MNQEPNNLNPNNFNTQGNNGIPNNQPLNNQSFNQGMGLNQQPINPQPQPTPSFQQPIMQEPTPQPVNNSFESGNANNQNFNSKPPKKMNLGLIIGIVVAVVAVIVVVILLLPKGNNSSSNNGMFGSSGNSITSEEISKYELETDTIWINKALGITYNIPKQISGSMLNGSGGFNYIHGSSFAYYSGYDIYVDKSLEGHTNLETLASDIIGEKISDKYKFVYEFGSTLKTQFNNTTTEKVKIGKIDTVYFESEELSTSSVVGNDLKVKLVGYSFKYNNEYISVYGELLMEENNKLEDLKQMLQYIINSIKEYKGESFKDLGGNAKNYYDGGYTSSLCSSISFDKDGKCTSNMCLEDCNKNYFIVNFLSDHTLNGVLRNYGDAYDVVKEIDASKVNWNGTLDGIFEATQNQKFEYNQYAKKDYPTYMYDFPWVSYDTNTWKNEITIEILKEEKLNINNIDIKKYLIKTRKGTLGGYYIAVYTFIVDNVPYVMSYHLDSSVYKAVNYIPNMTEEQSNIIINQTEIVADSSILTFRILNLEPYKNYTNFNQ